MARALTIRKYALERYFDVDDQNNAVLAHLVDCHDIGRTVSRKPNIHSGSLNNADPFSIDVSFNTFYSTAKRRYN